MSEAKNPNSVQTGQEIHGSVKPAEPLTTKGHEKVGRGGPDATKPEFHAKTFPPGSAPKVDTHKPNPINEIPGQANNPDMRDSDKTSALDSIPGATSATVYNDAQHGKPLQGQTSKEVRKGRVGTERHGFEGVGGGTMGDGSVFDKARDGAYDLDKDVKFTRGSLGRTAEERASKPGAEDKLPASAEEVASEMPGK